MNSEAVYYREFLMNLINIDPLLKKNWNDLILKSGEPSIFHTREWASILVNSYNYTPHYLGLFEKNNISLLIPLLEVNSPITGRRAVSLPFSDFCNPIVRKQINTEELIEFIDQYAKKNHWKYIDFHGGENLFESQPYSIKFYGHRIELSNDLNKTFSAFHSSTRRSIRRAIKLNVKIHFSDSVENWDHFYRLHCLTRKRHMVPAQPVRFFENIFHEIIKKKLGILLCASHRGKMFAAVVFFHFGDHAMYKFGASDYKYQHLRGNNLLMWEAIKWYSQQGYKTISFGRTDIEHSGLRRFKTGWGGAEYPMKYFKYDLRKKQFVTTDHAKRNAIMKIVFRFTPVGISRMLGNIIYKHFA